MNVKSVNLPVGGERATGGRTRIHHILDNLEVGRGTEREPINLCEKRLI